MKIKILNFLAIGASTIFAMPPSTIAQENSIKLTDPEIASVAVTANKVDIGFSQIAQKRSTNPDVLEFAKTMEKDHQGVIDQAVALVTRLNVTPQDNSLSKKLISDAETTKTNLNSKSGKEFDKAYIDNEVAYHKSVISVVQDVLIPQTQNAELKGLLEKVVPVLKTHLEHAQMVQGKISG